MYTDCWWNWASAMPNSGSSYSLTNYFCLNPFCSTSCNCVQQQERLTDVRSFTLFSTLFMIYVRQRLHVSYAAKMTVAESTDSDFNYDSLLYPDATVGMSNPILTNPSAQNADHSILQQWHLLKLWKWSCKLTDHPFVTHLSFYLYSHDLFWHNNKSASSQRRETCT